VTAEVELGEAGTSVAEHCAALETRDARAVMTVIEGAAH
jgi:hypothetical protein